MEAVNSMNESVLELENINSLIANIPKEEEITVIKLSAQDDSASNLDKPER